MKKIANIILGLSLLLSACNDDNSDIFNESVDQRIQQTLEEYETILCNAENGWIGYYNTAEYYGAYTFLMKFNKETKTVEIRADIDGYNDAKQAAYRLEVMEMPELCFETYSPFSYLHDPVIGRQGVGKYGDFEFFINSASKDEVVFTGKTAESKVRFVKAKKEDWTLFEQRLSQPQKLEKSCKGEFYFRNLILSGEINKKIEVSFSATDMYGDLRIVYLKYTEGDKVRTDTVEYAYTNEGFQFYEPFVYEGKEISEFVYQEAANNYTLKGVSGVEGKIVFDNEKAVPNVGAVKHFLAHNTEFYWMGNSDYTNELLRETELFDGPYGKMMASYMGHEDGKLGAGKHDMFFLNEDKRLAVKEWKTIGEDRIYAVFDEKAFDGVVLSEKQKEIIDVIKDPNGFYIVPKGVMLSRYAYFLVSKTDNKYNFFLFGTKAIE